MNPVRIGATACFLVILPILFFVRSGSADIYQYVDKNGTVVLTDDLHKVPEEYRGQVMVTREKDDGKGKSSEKALQGGKNTGKEKGKEPEGFQWEKVKASLKGFKKGRMFMPVLMIILYLALFFTVGNVCAFLEMRKLGLILRIVLTVCLLIYLFTTL